jgi:hypothetical protein
MIRGGGPSSTRHLTRTGHRPILEPPPVTDTRIGKPPADITGEALELWHAYVAERRTLGLLTRAQRLSLIFACRAVMQAEAKPSVGASDLVRKWLSELLVTAATRIKLGSSTKPHTAQQASTAVGRSLDLVANGKRRAG